MISLGPSLSPSSASFPVRSIGVSSSGNGGGGILFGILEGYTIDSNGDMTPGLRLGTIEWVVEDVFGSRPWPSCDAFTR